VSGVGFFGSAGYCAYAAAKAAIASLTTVTAIEMAPYGVTVNAISPVALTRLTATIMGTVPPTTSGFDMLDPENSSPVVAYLASDAAAWISGQILRIEGNVLKRMYGWRTGTESYEAVGDGRLTLGELVVGVPRLWGTVPAGLDVEAGAYSYRMDTNGRMGDE
jgi:hypothetical protein